MMSRTNTVSWMEHDNNNNNNRENQHQDCASPSWLRNTKVQNTNSNTNINTCGFVETRDELGSICGFKQPMMEVVDEEWYIANNSIQNHPNDMIRDMTFSPNFADPADNLLLHHHVPVDSSSSCSPSSSMFNNLDPSQVHQYFLPPNNPKPNTFSSLLNNNNNNNNPFEMGCEVGFLEPQASTTSPSVLNRTSSTLLGAFNDLNSKNQLSTLPNLASSSIIQLQQDATNFAGFQNNFEEGSGGNNNAMFLNRSKILRPLESLPPSGAQPTLFQKRAALRKNMGSESGIGIGSGGSVFGEGSDRKMMKMSNSVELDVEDGSFDGSGLNYDSDDLTESNNKVEENNGRNGGNSCNGNSTVTGGGVDQKGKKKGMPAKNLMAERRRRKKLNDRLYMLRSVVPKISKMDRASILGDAIEYLKELLQRINDLHNELESTPGSSSLTPVSSTFHPLTPTLPSRIKEELCPSSLPSPNGQPARVEVRLREGRAVNIHMFCSRKPGILLSTMRALDNMGLDIQQAVISCFNGFAMDIFRAKQCIEGQDVHPEQIKAVLLESAGFPGMI